MAACVPVSLAATNVAKLLVLVFGVIAILLDARGHSPAPALQAPRTRLMVLVALAALAMSLIYTSVPLARALDDLGKHAKLVVLLLVLTLLRSRREVWIALGVYIAAQLFVIFSSYLLAAGITPMWVYKVKRTSVATVFSSYIDQSLMTTGFALVCWHLRGYFPGRTGPWVAVVLAALAVFNVLFLLPGRSGHMAMILVLSLALFWALPRRWRPAMLLAPIAFAAAAMVASPRFNERLTQAVTETRAYSVENDATTSAGQRLHFWHRSLQAIAERPLTGFGVGTWNQQYHRLEGGQPSSFTAEVRNPHQEYLLWGVELGVGGIALLLALLAAMALDARGFAAPAQRAAQSMVAVLALNCLFNSPLYDALIGDYFCLLIGLLLAWGLHDRRENPPRPVAP